MKPLRILLIFASGGANATLSYQHAWPAHFQEHSAFRCTPVNLEDRRWSSRLRLNTVVRTWRGDAVVLLHSVFSNARLLDGWISDGVSRLRCPKALFIGNEYKLMPEKMRFCEELGVSLLVSQSSDPAVHALYRGRLGCAVTGIPNTGLDPAVFRPFVATSDRRIDLGYRAVDGPWYLGHRERREIADHFAGNAARYGLTVDISMEPQQRFEAAGWAGFLNDCKGQLGTEAGGDCFELTDETRNAVNGYLAEHPDASFAEVRTRFFEKRHWAVGMRILSGRNVEAAGTRTVQLLFRGRYDGYFEPDVHYIPLDKDFGNVDEALRKFHDDAFRERVVSNAYNLARAELTYDRLIDRFSCALSAVV